jgi:hypothetical protein
LSGSRQIYIEPTGVLQCKSAVCGLNGQRAKETVGLLLSKLANPEAKTGTIEIPVTYSGIGEGTVAAKNPFLAQLENEAGLGAGRKEGGAGDRVLRVEPESVTDHPVKSAFSRVVVVTVVTHQN